MHIRIAFDEGTFSTKSDMSKNPKGHVLVVRITRLIFNKIIRFRDRSHEIKEIIKNKIYNLKIICLLFVFCFYCLQVQLGSPAYGEVLRGDIIGKIGEYDARDLSHCDAQHLFRTAGNEINLVVRR